MGVHTPIRYLQSLQWGGFSLISLYLSIISGIIVGMQYDLTTPFYSVSALDLLVPYGEFFRSVHFFSSQLFFLFACIHFIVTYEKAQGYTFKHWLKLVFSLVAGLILLFTGYVLRGDSTGYSAGMIAEAILKTIPVIGGLSNDLLFAVSKHGMKRVYVHHVITFDLLWLMLVWDHLVRYKIKLSNHIPLICLTFVFCLIVAAPLEPEKLGVTYISGPWFFLGLQELLRYFPPFFAGVIFPFAFLLALLYARKEFRWCRYMLFFLYGWLGLYAVLSIVAWLRN